MVIPLSQLQNYIASALLKVQEARSHLMAQGTPIATEDPDSITFNFEVIDDTAGFMVTNQNETAQPDTETISQKLPEVQTNTTTQEAVTSKEKQVTTPGIQTTTKAFGRGTVTTVEETT
jgi:hypothetical protein